MPVNFTNRPWCTIDNKSQKKHVHSHTGRQKGHLTVLVPSHRQQASLGNHDGSRKEWSLLTFESCGSAIKNSVGAAKLRS